MRLVNKLVLASTNREKLEEFQALFSAYPGIEIISADQVVRNPRGLAFAEQHETYLENALAKARLINHGSHYPALADDSGLEVDALGGKPGVRSYRYATPKAGIPQDQANIELLLKELHGKPSTARFVCTLVLIMEGIVVHATGTLEGAIVTELRGSNGFGYDPVFVPTGATKTLAEMTSLEKNAISHRAQALQKLMAQVKSHGLVFAKP